MLFSATTTFGQLARPLDHPLDVDHRGDVAAAMADEHAHARRLVGDVALRRIGLGPRPACRAPGPAGPWPGRPRALACITVSGMSLGSWNAPPTNTPGRDVSSGCSSLVWAKPQRFSTTSIRSACSRSVALGSRPSESTIMSNSSSVCFISGTGVDDAQVLRPRHLVGPRDERTEISHAQLLLRPLAVAVEVLAEGAQVEEEHGHVQPRHVLLGQDRFLGRGHAADRGAIVVVAARIARADALDERQPLGRLPVAGRAGRARGSDRRPRAAARTARS